MTDRETADLTDAMKNSGRCLDWDVVTADKHSSGGVGDKLSLVIQPLAAACGVCVPSLTGRGLGITGGTADKLETIPGYSCAQAIERFPGDHPYGRVCRWPCRQTSHSRRPQALCIARPSTGNGRFDSLIVASILSKKLAEGAGTLVFDVKCGRGAFMKTREDAESLAHALVDGAKAAGRKAAALVHEHGRSAWLAVANANEVAERCRFSA